MSDSGRYPEPLSLTGNLDSNWKTFKQRFEIFLCANGHEDKPSKRKVMMLLDAAGPEAVDIYNTFEFPAQEAREGNADGQRQAGEGVGQNIPPHHQYDLVVAEFDKYCAPKSNETYERYMLRTRVQKESEPFESFLTDLRLKAKSCNYGELKDGIIRDQVVYGIHDSAVRARLLREGQLTLQRAIEICQASEVSHKQMSVFEEGGLGQTAVHVVRKSQGATKKKGSKGKQQQRGNTAQESCSKQQRECKFCGTTHPPKKCPAWRHHDGFTVTSYTVTCLYNPGRGASLRPPIASPSAMLVELIKFYE